MHIWPWYYMTLKAFRSKRSGVVYDGFRHRFFRLQCRPFGYVLADIVIVRTYRADSFTCLRQHVEPFTKQDAAGLVGSGWRAGK